MSSSETPRPGDVIGGRYRLDALARDSRSCMYFHGTEIATNAKVSVQILVAETTDEARMRFLAGARRAIPLAGARIARVRDGGVTKTGLPWVVREGLPEVSLAQLLAVKKSLPTTLAVDIALGVCAALCEAHAKGIVHGDLSAHSIFLIDDDVKIADLGTGEVTGTLSSDDPLIRAPEQIQGTPLDVRADVWSVGVLLHTMLSGEAPFGSDSPSTVNLAVVLDDPPSLAGVPDELAEIVEGCLAKQPDARIRSVFALADKLAPFAGKPILIPTEMTESTPTLVVKDEEYEALVRKEKEKRESIPLELTSSVRDVSVPAKPKPEPRRSWTPLALGAAAALIAFVAAGLAGSRSEPAPVLAVSPAHLPPPHVSVAPPAPTDAASVTASDLPAATSTADAPARPAALPPPSAQKRPPKPAAPRATADEPAPVVAVAAPAPVPPPQQPKPEPKVESDDLRRFLDDRR